MGTMKIAAMALGAVGGAIETRVVKGVVIMALLCLIAIGIGARAFGRAVA